MIYNSDVPEGKKKEELLRAAKLSNSVEFIKQNALHVVKEELAAQTKGKKKEKNA